MDAPPKPARSRATVRPESFEEAGDRLSWIERFNVRLVHKTFENQTLDRMLGWAMRTVGAFWVYHCTKNVVLTRGIERAGSLEKLDSAIIVSNHRSFFDMFVINMLMYKNGFNQRMFFPVRANFFYTSIAGSFVNFVMSWFSMYPPIFRDRKRLSLNHTALSELARALTEGRRSTGIHPEGTRNLDEDPYTFLPAQSGVGRLIYLAKAPVIPVFINGLINDLKKQVAGNFNGKGQKVIVVFGEPIDFKDLLEAPPTAKTYRAIAERTLEVIGQLGQEEKAARAELAPTSTQSPEHAQQTDD